ncbi:MAG TPA: cytochrome P460 family protein [Candidatus Acidoferrales bacterium]|nr:cytochrome P460 family protein [Candidatus Acidoferrales bacterium]
MMTKAFLLSLAALTCFTVAYAVAEDRDATRPQYEGGKLVRPDAYREWIYLSSGLGMNYNPSAGGPDLFTNVFVPQWAYREFLSTGTWPEKTMFVLEERASQTKGSINKAGHFQTDLEGLAVEVKDTRQFPDTWAYFGFGGDARTAVANAKSACWQCHNDHAAVEHTFVQFYPTLKPIAQKYGTYKESSAP